ncbi:MAG: putative bifunctional diguanylate cyclase/phosphodiesterase [Bosea sp. (in: a-proteobacteria)]
MSARSRAARRATRKLLQRTGIGSSFGKAKQTIAAAVISIAATLTCAVMAMFSITDQANMTDAYRQYGRVSASLYNELSSMRRQLAGLVAQPNNDALTLTGESLRGFRQMFIEGSAELYNFDGAYLTLSDGTVLAGMEGRRAAGQAGFDGLREFAARIVSEAYQNHTNAQNQRRGQLSRLSAMNSAEANGVARFVHDGTSFLAVTAVPVELNDFVSTDGSKTIGIAFAYRTIHEFSLQAFANKNRIVNLRLASADAADKISSFSLYDGLDRPTAWLAWSADRPGDAMLLRFLSAMIATLIFCGLTLYWLLGKMRGSALEMARRAEMIERLAGHDELSGLPNRRTFDLRLEQELARIERAGGGLAVHYLDLDKFKAVNDTYGHKAGDELIREVSRRLSTLMRGADTIARFGGDEFAIIQTEVNLPSDAASLGQRILDVIHRPFILQGGEASVGVSIGIALAPQNGKEREGLERLADAALYQAKNNGRNRYSFFEQQMDRSLQMKRVVEEELRSAIANDELVLHYQPQVSADGRTIIGVEALVRWHHPVQGMIPPSDFIPIAEERGLIVPLSDWVLKQACIDGVRWPGLRLAVNVSPIQFRHKDFVENVARTLQKTGFDGTRLELEITEGVVVDDADAAEAAMMELRAHGIGLALDDFGTGYSSLIYLRRFAFDKIKIDRSFLEYMETTGESAILVHSVVHLGRALGLRVCAEGVETAEQHRFLQAVGCHELQGYLFSKPVPAAKIDELLAAQEPFAKALAA